jgi:adenine-specific DNA-methyltransferase
VFGESNFVAELVWERAYSPKNDAKYISNSHDYVLMYAKQIENFQIGRLERTEEANARYTNPDNDPRGVWKPGDMSVKTYSAAYDYPITTPSGKIVEPPTGRCWRFSKEAFEAALKDNRVSFGTNNDSVPQIKRFLTELKFEGMAPQSLMFYKDVGHSQEGAKEVTALLEAGAFQGPKPVRLLRRLLTLANLDNDSIVMDFFSGSATTAHAVMQLNAEDSGKRKFIMVQLPEVCAEGTEAAKAGYATICEIGKERIRRAGEMITAKNAKNAKNEQEILDDSFRDFSVVRGSNKLDIGFRVLKLAETNMNDVYYAAGETTQDMLSLFESNIKPDRADMDLLYGCLLDWGLPLSMPHTTETIDGVIVHTYNNGDLIACFADKISDTVVKVIANKQPLRAVFRDSSFANSPEKINVTEIFKLFAPNTSVKVI